MPKGQRARIEVTPEDAATLRMWAGSRRGERRLAERAQVILLSSAGASLAEISGRTGLSPQGCSRWRQRFAEGGLDGLRDRPRPGRPLVIDAQTRLSVVALASSAPPDGCAHWSTRRWPRRPASARLGFGIGTPAPFSFTYNPSQRRRC